MEKYLIAFPQDENVYEVTSDSLVNAMVELAHHLTDIGDWGLVEPEDLRPTEKPQPAFGTSELVH
jgi:hypothetical protein